MDITDIVAMLTKKQSEQLTEAVKAVYCGQIVGWRVNNAGGLDFITAEALYHPLQEPAISGI